MNCVITISKDTDFLAGTLPFQVRVANSWEKYLPDFDPQKQGGLETDACVPFSAVESVETQVNFLRPLLPQSTVDKLQELGFFDAEGKFEASERFLAKVDGTSANGTSMTAAWDAIRKYGMLPYKDWPFTAGMAWNEFYKPVPQNLLDKAKEFSKLFNVQYEWIKNGGSAPHVAMIAKHIQQAPLCIGTPVCEPWDQLNPPVCNGLPSSHSTMIYKLEGSNAGILDHYNPMLKTLVALYPIPYILKGVVTAIQPAPIPPVPPLPANPTNPQISTWLTAISAWIASILASLKGRNLTSNKMSPSFSISQAQILAVLKGFGIAELGAVLAVASLTVASGNFDIHTFLIAEAGAISSTAVNFLRKYLPSSPAEQ